MRSWFIVSIGVMSLFLATAPSLLPADETPAVVAHIPKDLIQVTGDYHGERLLIYGVIAPDCEIIVKLSSPRIPVTFAVRKRVGIFWITVDRVSFNNVPWMFKIRSTKPLDQILSYEKQLKYRIGLHGLLASIEGATPKASNPLVEEMVQSRVEDRLYSFHEGEVRRIKGNMFEASFFWPPKAPSGLYHVDTFAVRDGEVISVDSERVKVEKVGVEAYVSTLASRHGFLYGLLAVAVASISGLLVGMVFRGMGPRRKRNTAAIH